MDYSNLPGIIQTSLSVRSISTLAQSWIGWEYITGQGYPTFLHQLGSVTELSVPCPKNSVQRHIAYCSHQGSTCYPLNRPLHLAAWCYIVSLSKALHVHVPTLFHHHVYMMCCVLLRKQCWIVLLHVSGICMTIIHETDVVERRLM